MSRVHRYLYTVASSYVALAAGMLYALITVPLALHYLPKAEFGLWAVMTQIVGYLGLIDLGMQSSVARHLIDYKDDPAAGPYGAVLVTGSLVLAVQAVLIGLAGIGASPMLARALAIEPELAAKFIVLLRWQSVLVAFGFATRIFGQVIHAHQRNDLANYVQVAGFGITLGATWWAFVAGQGVFSVLWGGGAGTVFQAFMQWWIVVRWRLLPGRNGWRGPSAKLFRMLFSYGKDVFLVSFGMQLVNASQVIIVTRTLGLEMAATWSVCTRVLMSGAELVFRLSNYAEPMFAEMVVRGERLQLCRRFHDLVSLVSALSLWVGVGFAVLNQPFVALWTTGKIGWAVGNDVILAVWLLVRTVTRCYIGLSLMTKEIRQLPWVISAEGIVFIGASFLVVPRWGVGSMVALSLATMLMFSGRYIVKQTATSFGLSGTEVAWDWFREARRFLVFGAPLAVGVWWATRSLPSLWRLSVGAVALGLGASWLLCRVGIHPELRQELAGRTPARWRTTVSMILGVKP